MLPPPPQSFVLSAKSWADLTKGPIGKFKLHLTPEASQDFALLDTFDQDLRRSGRLLLATSRTLLLCQPDGLVMTQLAARRHFVADLPEGPVKAALADLSKLRCLLPQGQGHITPARLALLDDADKTCVRAHLRLLTTDRGSAILVTLQGLLGYDKALAAMRHHLECCGAHPPVALCEALPGLPAYRAKPEIDIGPHDTAFDAVTRIVAAYLPMLRAHEAGIIADHDSEFLHDYRIGLRKIRMVLGLFNGTYRADRTEALRMRFAALMHATGPLRDLDVALLDRDRAFSLLPPVLHPGLETLFLTLKAERQAAHLAVAAHLQSRSYAAEIADLTRLFTKPRHLGPGRLAEMPAQDIALRLIRARHQKICTLADRITPDTPDADLHLLRLHFKKLRYLLEFFAPLFPALPFKTIRKAIKELQDLLGQFNDGSVQQVNLQDFLSRQPAGTSIAMAQSVGALMAVLHGRQAAERAAALTALQAFTGPQLRASFDTLISGAEEAS